MIPAVSRVRHLGLTVVLASIVAGTGSFRAEGQPPGAATIRLHGMVEPVRSYPVLVPRLTGQGNNSVVITHLTRPGTRVERGDLLVEFDRQTQTKTANDRVALRDNDPRLRSGMSASPRIEMEHLPNVLVVPAGAVFRRDARRSRM